jgi:threo-3-hydroxy-L-aspartate ammonia-lyase
MLCEPPGCRITWKLVGMLAWAIRLRRLWRPRKIIKIDTPKTIADGAQTQFLGQLTFPVIQELVDDIVTVSDAQLIEAMRFAASRMKMVIEPTGGLAMAAAMQGVVNVKGQRVGVIISGGNVDIAQLAQYLATA